MYFDYYPTESLMFITHRPKIIFVNGKGSLLYDHNEKCYLDFIQGWAVNSLGHCDEGIIKVIYNQAKQLINSSPAYYNEPMILLADLLTKNSVFDKVFFTNSGAEANEGAIKLARKWGKKYKNGAYEIITFNNSFHGRTLATMSASGKLSWNNLFEPKLQGFLKANFNDIYSVENFITSKTVAIMLELIQGEGGVLPANPTFIRELTNLTHKYNLLLIVDEIQTGCGRTGKLFAYQKYNLVPDIMTLGKGIGGGVPLAALLTRKDISIFEAGEQGGTYNGNPLMTAVGYEVMSRIIKPSFLEKIQSVSNYMQQSLLKISKEYNFDGERGEGLLRALLLPKSIAPLIVDNALNLNPTGLLLNAPQPNLLRFMPALNISHVEIDQMINLLNNALKITLKY